MTPRVAVVIPVYDREDVVGRAIASVLRQDMADFELVVVDDGSTDRTVEVVAKIADPRLTLLRQPVNRGGNAARNLGIRATSAPLIAFLDSDDEYLPDKLAAIVAMFDAAPDLGAVLDSYTLAASSKAGGRPVDRTNPVIDDGAEFLAALFDSSRRSHRLRKSASGITVRRDLAARAGLFDETIGRRQDTEFLIRLAKAGRCVATDRRLWIKHNRPDGLTSTSTGYIAATLAICARHPEYVADRTLRGGLAHDVLHCLWQTARRRGMTPLVRDVRLLVGVFGAVRVAKLIGRAVAALAADAIAGGRARRPAARPRTGGGHRPAAGRTASRSH